MGGGGHGGEVGGVVGIGYRLYKGIKISII